MTNRHGTPERDNAASLSAALRYLALGFCPLPITPGAHEPLIRWKPLQTTRPTVAAIRDWYRRWPAAGVGIICGAVSGIVVLDRDPRNGPGLELDDGTGCPTVATPGGGWHRYYAYAPVPSTHPLVPGLDVQSDRTYVIAPPSQRTGKVYAFTGETARHLAQLPPLPGAIVERLERHRAPRTERGHSSVSTGSVDLATALHLLAEVKQVGPAQWMSACPLHDDRTPSLAVSVGVDGRVLLYCHAGCRFGDLIAHLAAAVSA